MNFYYRKRLPLKRPIKPKSFREGEQFEDFVRDFIFTNDFYSVVHKTHSFKQNAEDFIEDSKNPDFIFCAHGEKRPFHVECKFKNFAENYSQIDGILERHNYDPRQNLPKDTRIQIEREIRKYTQVDIYRPDQFRRHRALNARQPVFVCLGLYDSSNSDLVVYVVPITAMLCHFTRLESLDIFVTPNNFPMTPDRLWSMADTPLEGFCIRCKARIAADPEQPFCESCWPKWYERMDFRIIERFCHTCGTLEQVSAARPDCSTCYKKAVEDRHTT